jgi:hypothetical protein
MDWWVTRIEWPEGAPPFTGATSLFDGRCSEPSDYVIYGSFAGQATHAGRFTGEGSHCSRGTLVAASGSTLLVRWGNGTSGFDPATGDT